MVDAMKARRDLGHTGTEAGTAEGHEGLCEYALGCRAPAEWMTGISPRCSLHRAMLDADPARERIVAMHPQLAWRPVARAALTMAVPLLLFMLLPGCASESSDPWPWPLFVGAAFTAGVALTLLLVRVTERCRQCGCDPEDRTGAGL